METSNRKVGRPDLKSSDQNALDDILRSPEKRKALVESIKRFAKDKDLHKQRGKALQEDLKAVAKDTFGLSVKKMNELISDFDSGKLDDRIAEKTSTVDVLEIVKEMTSNEEVG